MTVTFNPSSVTVTVPAFYITVNGNTSSVDVDNYATLKLVANDLPQHNVEFWYATSDPSKNPGTAKTLISETNSVPSSGQYSDSYEVSHNDNSTMTIWIGASDLTDSVDSNYVKVNVAAPVVTTVDWWVYTESLSVETEVAGYGASSDSYETGSPAGATNIGVRGQVLDSKGNGINGVSVTVTGFETSPLTVTTHTDSLNGAVGMFDTGAQTIPANNGTSTASHDISVSV